MRAVRNSGRFGGGLARCRPAFGLLEFMNHTAPIAHATALLQSNPSNVNVPNTLTAIRFGLAVGVVAFIAMGGYGTAVILFSIAAGTDWMDGYWARRYGQVTKLGRIFDPFVDKIIIGGTFIALVAVPEAGVAAWVAIVIMARELLVTSLRGMIEGAGGDFSANQPGKWKMVAQCTAAISTLLHLVYPTIGWIEVTSVVSIWVAIAMTLYSGWIYVVAASRMRLGGGS